MDNNYNLNWYNYKSFEPKDLSNFGIGYNYPLSPSYQPPRDYGSVGGGDRGFKPNSYAPYVPYAGGSGSGSWWGKAWDSTKAFLPQNYGEAGALLSGVGSVYGAITGAKRAKEANEIARDNLDEIRKRNAKLDKEKEDLANSVSSVWNRE